MGHGIKENELINMEDLDIRKEFAKAFNWYSYENQFGYSRQEKKLLEPTWGEIFIEVGKILERATEKDVICCKQLEEIK